MRPSEAEAVLSIQNMNIASLITLFAVLINFGGDCSPTSIFLNSDVINVKQAVSYLNNIEGRTWTAGSNNFGEYLTVSEARTGSLRFKRGGADVSVRIKINFNTEDKNDENQDETHVFSYEDLPENYDTREMFPHCTTISSIKDQSTCGSCWAVATAAAFSDRLCIHSKGLINVNISSSHILSCLGPPDENGCHGGWEDQSWNFMKNNGVVTGGDYGTFEGCQPYPIKPCGKPDQMPCDEADEGLTPICLQNKCTNEWHEPIGELYKAKSTLQMPCNSTNPCQEIDIRNEIYRNGPVTAAFKLYPPFYFYKSGIFQTDLSRYPKSNSGHIVRIVGWGIENNIPYWIVANSWGRRWGENGFFRILRGKNYSNIESYISSGIPAIPFDVN